MRGRKRGRCSDGKAGNRRFQIGNHIFYNVLSAEIHQTRTKMNSNGCLHAQNLLNRQKPSNFRLQITIWKRLAGSDGSWTESNSQQKSLVYQCQTKSWQGRWGQRRWFLWTELSWYVCFLCYDQIYRVIVHAYQLVYMLEHNLDRAQNLSQIVSGSWTSVTGCWHWVTLGSFVNKLAMGVWISMEPF